MKYSTAKLSKETFFPVYSEWCALHGFPVVNYDWLPETAFVAYTAKDEPMYCIWGWQTDSKVFWTGFPASNLNIPFEDRNSGLDFLLNFINDYAKKEGYAAVFSTSGTEAVINSLTKNDFIVGDTGINHYFKIL
jgi:hypothetical protein